MGVLASGSGRVSVPLSQLPLDAELDCDIYAGSNLLLRAGAKLTAQLVASLAKRGLQEIQVSAQSVLAPAPQAALPAGGPGAFDAILATAAQIYQAHGIETAVPEEMLSQATDHVEHIFDEIEKGQSVALEELRGTVSTMVAQFLTRPTFAVKLMDLENFDRYTYRHSINVGLLMLSVVQDWYKHEEQLIDVVYGALLHDVGKARVGFEIINKAGKLDESEWQLMRMHPVWSEELMRDTDASPTARAIARWHHERLDGTGYPDGLRAEQMVREVRLSGIVDVYDALTTKRSYKAKMDFGAAIGLIVQDCGKHFDPVLANQFIRRMGRYPVGSFVRLSTGDVAVVKEVNPDAVTRPTVSRVSDASGNLLRPEALDLRKEPRITIISVLSPGAKPAEPIS
jgi:HD-GYP domain-containing protein (c-di-GMP phosphodiesterase class II)